MNEEQKKNFNMSRRCYRALWKAYYRLELPLFNWVGKPDGETWLRLNILFFELPSFRKVKKCEYERDEVRTIEDLARWLDADEPTIMRLRDELYETSAYREIIELSHLLGITADEKS